jgi:transcriptional regulator with GAF, ATPase, and Fis domain
MIWREACLNLDIADFTERAAETLAAAMPLRLLLVRRLTRDGRTVATVGVGPPAAAKSYLGARAELTVREAAVFQEWLRAGAGSSPSHPGPAAAVPAGLGGGLLALPLRGQRGAQGVLLVQFAPGISLDADLMARCDELREPFAAALENDRHLRELNALQRSAEADRQSLLVRLGRDQLLETVVGAETGLRGVMQRVEMVAASDVPVLLLGETGAGKEVIARAVHVRSRRAKGPFTRVNCGAISPELVDSELFGHEKGSFTGATGRRRGWFERSDRGTLLLDEIGELPKAAQVRLLRVLQDGLVSRVGGEEPVPVDVRVIAATHADLPAMVQRGEFREDLWYRLAVFPLVLPPLRERTEDIPTMVEMLVQRASRHFGLRPQAATAADLALLAAYPWPGNVRELGSVIDRAVILGGGKKLEVAKALGFATSVTRTPSSPDPVAPMPEEIVSLDDAVSRHIRAALAATGGRIEGARGAAALLRVNPHTLRARMRRLGIVWSSYRSLR